MLDIDTAIKHCLEVAEQNETQADKIGRQLIGSAIDKYATDCRECAAEHRQLAEWLKELKEAKRLLKAAVEDIHKKCSCECSHYKGRDCDICEKHGNCSYADSFKWCKADIALKLIGETNDEP